MDKRTREKLALIVFIALIAMSGIIVYAYLTTGRSWTRAATVVDDTVGYMDGYTAVVFSGTAPKSLDKATEAPTPMSSSSTFSSNASSNLNSTYSSNFASGKNNATDVDKNATESADETASTIDNESPNISELILTDSMGLRILALYPGDLTPGFDGVFVSDVRDLYEQKDASVITLDLADVSDYSDGVILSTDSRKIGVFSLKNAVSTKIMQSKIADLQARGAESIICIAPRPASITYYEGINAIIFTDPDADITSNNAIKGTAIMAEPSKGEVGVLIFTRNNTTSTKVISVL
jgi:hypothetical protein